MRLADLMADPDVVAVRRDKWASPTDVLILAPVVGTVPWGVPLREKALRGPWCALRAFDGREYISRPMSTTDLLACIQTDWRACNVPEGVRDQ